MGVSHHEGIDMAAHPILLVEVEPAKDVRLDLLHLEYSIASLQLKVRNKQTESSEQVDCYQRAMRMKEVTIIPISSGFSRERSSQILICHLIV